MRDSCERCKWWSEPLIGEIDGECRAHPPSCVDFSGKAVWPKTRNRDCCGVFFEKEQPK